MHKCNGVDNGDCDNCRNRYCKEWMECDICHEEIWGNCYHINDRDYCSDCYEREFGRNV